jgi:cell migration-inducing and hyaluronan-binding protein
MAMAGSKMYVSGVELSRMGQNMHLARYPIHWHLGGEGQGQYIRNSAIHDTYSRCVTVHGTNNVLVENNVTFNTVGHCFFLEDAVETGNQFVHNLAIQTKCHPDGKPCVPTDLTLAHQSPAGQSANDILIPSDNTAASFWITNPDNDLPGQRRRGVRGDRLLDRLAAASHRGAFSRTRAARLSGPGARNCASSAATPPTPTSTG